MIKSLSATAIAAFCLLGSSPLASQTDTRQLVNMPGIMQAHLLRNMRDHLATVNQLLVLLNTGKFDEAAELAEKSLGMSSLEQHGAAHMAPFMPKNMQELGTRLHSAASQFALRAQEGEAAPAYAALADITGTCVACHDVYRIR